LILQFGKVDATILGLFVLTTLSGEMTGVYLFSGSGYLLELS
jgi:hypothetical protein